MSKSVVAKRYATALFDLAQEKGQTDAVQEDLLVLKKAYRDNAGLEELLHSPRLSMADKKNVLANSFAGANPIVLNTIFILLEKKRIHEVVDVVDEFVALANDAAGIAEAKVFSTRPLTEQESASISTVFAQKVGKHSLRIENIIDPSLIGGIRLQIGNQIYDSSLSGKLGRLKQDLIGS